MRVLSVGNMYPPHHLGGYELVWRSAVGHLRDEGHPVRVLTTDFRTTAASGREDEDVHRELRWYWRDHAFPRLDPRQRLALERHNAVTFERHVAEFAPDVVSWWAMGGMSLSLVGRARALGLPAVAFVHDDWLLYGPLVDAWLRLFAGRGRALARTVERMTGIPTRLDTEAVDQWIFVSEATRRSAGRAGWHLRSSAIAHSGVEGRFLAPAPEVPWRWRLLYVGRVDERKGIDTAVEALTRLPEQARLTVIGHGDPAADARLRALADRIAPGRVDFAGPLARDELHERYGDADVVVFPARWEEPWGLVPLEAMGRGRPVVATGRGGSAEYLRDGANCLLFEAGDADALARAVRALGGDPALRERLREGGMRTASQHTEAAFNRRVAEALERAARRRPLADQALSA